MNRCESLEASVARLGRGEADAGSLLEEARSRLDGVPGDARVLRHRFEVPGSADGDWFGVGYLTKANIAVEGQPLDCCSAILEGFRAPYEATVTRLLRERGATCLGSTNMDEFGMGGSGETSNMGAPPHPFLANRVCGGSSSGAASAVARGLVPFALGSDTGGSVRQPAAYCGLVGVKPTWGRVSRYGLVAHASSLDTIGAIASDVGDVAAVLGAIAGPDEIDSTVAEFPHPIEICSAESVGVLRPEPDAVSPDVASNLDEVTDALRKSGVEVREVRLASLRPALAAYVVLAAAETASNLARYDGKLYGARVEAATYEESLARTRAAGFGEEVKLRILLGTEVLRQGHTANALGRAKSLVARLRREFEEVFASAQAILMPTVPTTAFELGSRTSDPLSMRDADRFTVGPSLLGLPAVAVPSGEGAEGAPLSVQCVAARGRDDLALGLASQVEQLMRVDRWREESWWPRTPRAAP